MAHDNPGSRSASILTPHCKLGCALLVVGGIAVATLRSNYYETAINYLALGDKRPPLDEFHLHVLLESSPELMVAANDLQISSIGAEQAAANFLSSGDADEAIRITSKLISSGQANSMSFMVRGRAYLAKDLPEAAIRDFTEFLTYCGVCDLGYVSGLIGLASAKEEIGNFHAALIDLEVAIDCVGASKKSPGTIGPADLLGRLESDYERILGLRDADMRRTRED